MERDEELVPMGEMVDENDFDIRYRNSLVGSRPHLMHDNYGITFFEN